MTMLFVNGAETPLPTDSSLLQLLRELAIDPTLPGIAVAINGEVVARSAWPEQLVEAQDRVEIIQAVQGG